MWNFGRTNNPKGKEKLICKMITIEKIKSNIYFELNRLTDEYNFLLALPSYFSKVEKMILLIDKFNPIPIASDATRTSYPDSGALNNRACSFLASGGRPPLI